MLHFLTEFTIVAKMNPTLIVVVLAAVAISASSAASVHRVKRQVVPPELAKLNLTNYLKVNFNPNSSSY